MRQLLDYVRHVFDLVGEVQRLRDELHETREEINRINERNNLMVMEMRDILHEFQRLGENEQHEREKLMLQLKIEMLNFERRLPPPPRDERNA